MMPVVRLSLTIDGASFHEEEYAFTEQEMDDTAFLREYGGQALVEAVRTRDEWERQRKAQNARA